ncbi:MAG: helix-turn-helix transcriptional regulator [Mariniblastus sp.]|nr:helix-turn-helix transcriptional regulator [Mariniblastus sp.]
MAEKLTGSNKLTDQLRQVIDDSGVTRSRIAQETGISEATLSKFHLGQRGLSIDALNALGEFLQLKITLGRKPESKGN